MMAILFCLVTFAGSVAATHLAPIWYGIGLTIGAFAGWCVAYIRLAWVEKHMDAHIFCRGELIPRARGIKPSGKVYDRKEQEEKQAERSV